MGTKLITPAATLCFASLFKPTSFDGGAPKFEATLVFPAGTDLKELKAACLEAGKIKFPGKDLKKLNLKSPFRKGSERKQKDSDEQMDGFPEDSIFIICRGEAPPGVIGPDKRYLKEGEIWSGCIVRGSVNAFGYDTKGNKGVAFGLNHIQLINKGPRFGGGGLAEDEFDAIEGHDNGGDDASDMFD